MQNEQERKKKLEANQQVEVMITYILQENINYEISRFFSFLCLLLTINVMPGSGSNCPVWITFCIKICLRFYDVFLSVLEKQTTCNAWHEFDRFDRTKPRGFVAFQF